MSLSWNRPRLRVFVGEDYLAICRVGGIRRARVLGKDRVPLAAGEGAVATALEGWLAAHPLPAGSRLELVLGLPHVRYLMLPWSEELAQAAFRESLARALFSRQFQEEFAAQEIRFGTVRFGRPLLVACLGRALLASVAAVAAKHRLQLDCVEPLLVAVCRGFRSPLRRFTGTLLVAEASRVLIVRHERGVLAELQVRPAGADDVVALAQRLAIEEACKVFAPQQALLAGSLPAAWLEPGRREGFDMTSDGAYAFALCGVR